VKSAMLKSSCGRADAPNPPIGRIANQAAEALQLAVESYLVDLFALGSVLRDHARRTTFMPQDLALALAISKLSA